MNENKNDWKSLKELKKRIFFLSSSPFTDFREGINTKHFQPLQAQNRAEIKSEASYSKIISFASTQQIAQPKVSCPRFDCIHDFSTPNWILLTI